LIAGPAVPVVADFCCEPEEAMEGAEAAPTASFSDLAAEAEAASRAASALKT